MRKCLLIALAGISLVACREANEEPSRAEEIRNVSITIQNEQISRSALSQSVNEGAVTAFTDGKLFFFDATGKTVHTHELSAYPTEPFTVGVPTSADSVAMIANYKGTELAAEDPATIAAFRLMKYGIDNQADMAGATGSLAPGQPNAVQGIALLDTLGNDRIAHHLEEVTGQAYTHTAAITLVPAVARLEIAEDAVRVRSVNLTNLTGFDFSGIYINNYSANYAVGLAQDAALLGSTITDGGSENWVAEYKELSPSAHLYAEPVGPATSLAAGGYAFHVFPGEVPHIILRGNDFEFTGSANKVAGPLFWRIEKYWEATEDEEKTEITEFKPGYVYKITSIEVGNSYPTVDPYDEAVSVQVTLTVQAWNEVGVFVEPE